MSSWPCPGCAASSTYSDIGSVSGTEVTEDDEAETVAPGAVAVMGWVEAAGVAGVQQEEGEEAWDEAQGGAAPDPGEGMFDHIFGAPPESTGPEPGLELVPGKTRRRRRDGQIVKRSSGAYHLYKRSKRVLRRSKVYYVGGVEDQCVFLPHLHGAWATVRIWHCRVLAEVLLAKKVTDETMHKAILFEMEAVVQWVYAHPSEAKKLNLGSAVQWVGMLAQQQRAMQSRFGWGMFSEAEIQSWTLPTILGALEGVGGKDRDTLVSTLPSEATSPDAAKALGAIMGKVGVFLAEGSPGRRSAPSDPPMFDGIVNLQPAELLPAWYK